MTLTVGTVKSGLPIRVAYDISFLAGFVHDPAGQSGVHRTVEELLTALNGRDDVDVSAIAACGRDLLLDVTNASAYLQRRPTPFQFDSAMAGRLGLSKLYARMFSGPGGAAHASASGAPRRSRNYQRIHYRLTNLVRKVDQPRLKFEARRYDIFHSPFLPLPARELIGEIPRMLTIYDLIFLKRPDFMTPGLVSFLQKIFDSIDINCDWVTCISEFTRDEFCDFTGMERERVFVAPLAAADHFRVVESRDEIQATLRRYGIPDANYFLALSTLQPRKNFPHLIRCFFRLLKEHPDLDANLVIVGASGWLDGEVFEASDSCAEFRDRIILAGYVPNEDLSAIYSGALAFVSPSLYEGFGLPALEAMQCGTPVIVSNTTSFPEVVGRAGILIDPTDADALCNAMLEIANDETLRERLRAEGLARSRDFTWALCAEKTVQAYRAALRA